MHLSRLSSQSYESVWNLPYNNEAIEIIDARNHLFRNVGRMHTDESLNIYAIRDLCHVDEETLETVPNRMKFKAIAKNYF